MPGTERHSSRTSGFQALLRSYDSRHRTTDAAEAAFRLLALGTLLSLALLSLLWWSGRSAPFPLWSLSPLLLVFVPLARRLLGAPEPAMTAARIDQDHGYDDLIKTAHALSESEVAGPFESLTVARAAQSLDLETPTSLFPWKLPRGPLLISCLAPLLLLLVALSHRPESGRLLGTFAQRNDSDDAASAALETRDPEAAAAEEDVPEPEIPEPTAVPRIPLDGELAELSELAQMGEQIDIPESLELSDATTLTEATAQELAEMLEQASKTLGDELVQEESRRQEEAGAEVEPPSEGGAPPLSERRAAPEGEHEGRTAEETAEGAEADEQGQEAGAEQMQVPSPFKPKMERSQAESQAGEQMAGMDVGGQAKEAEPTAGQPNEGDAAGSFGDSTAPQGEEVTPFGEATEMPVTLEIAILEAQKQEEKIEGEKRERASEAQESKVAFRNVRTPSEYSASNAVAQEPVSWLHRDLVRDYFLQLDGVLEAEVERKRALAEARAARAASPKSQNPSSEPQSSEGEQP